MRRKTPNSFPSQGPFAQSFIFGIQSGATASDGLFRLQWCVDAGFCLALIENPSPAAAGTVVRGYEAVKPLILFNQKSK